MLKYAAISTIIQFVLFITLPLIYYVIKFRGLKGFWSWIGLKAAPPLDRRLTLKIIIVLFLYILTTPAFILLGNFKASGIPYDAFYTLGFNIESVLIVLMWAVIQTSLSEELFFRGFLRQVFFRKKSWIIGNLIQAILFGAIHAVGYLKLSIPVVVGLFLLTGTSAYLAGWLVEKKSNGSIVYSWALHAIANIISVSLSIYLMSRGM